MQYDAATKYLVSEFPVDWLLLTGIRPTGPVDLIDANLSTVTAEADKDRRFNNLPESRNPGLRVAGVCGTPQPRLSSDN